MHGNAKNTSDPREDPSGLLSQRSTWRPIITFKLNLRHFVHHPIICSLFVDCGWKGKLDKPQCHAIPSKFNTTCMF
eukprot:4145102-Amphidinium_carterae.1